MEYLGNQMSQKYTLRGRNLKLDSYEYQITAGTTKNFDVENEGKIEERIKNDEGVELENVTYLGFHTDS